MNLTDLPEVVASAKPEPSPHVLVLAYDGDGNPEYDIEHPDDCPTIALYDGSVIDYSCPVGYEASCAGIDFYFPARPEAAHSYGEQLAVPGRYLIEHWHETHGTRYGPEYEAGLRLVYPKEAHGG